MAYPLGRHPIGYEVQKVLALVDWLEARSSPGAGIGPGRARRGRTDRSPCRCRDPRIVACLVSGYFSARERVWQEPVYRNVWALLTEFGDAEIGSLVLPRTLVIEHSRALGWRSPSRSRGPQVGGRSRQDRNSPAERVISEFKRLEQWAASLPAAPRARVKLVPPDPRTGTVPVGSQTALQGLLEPLAESAVVAAAPGVAPKRTGKGPMRSTSNGAWSAAFRGRFRTCCGSRAASGTNAI